MLKDLIDLVLHRVPWDGDKIRLYRRTAKPQDKFIGEFWLKIQSGEVYVENHGYIRRDLPQWSERFSCWSYQYEE